VETALDEADRLAEEDGKRMSHEEVFGKSAEEDKCSMKNTD
jgi:hypothetical protein